MKSVQLRRTDKVGTPSSALVETAIPEISSGELLVKMEACGLCGTDIEKMHGEYTAAMPVLGHEAVGVVTEVGDGVSGFRKGDRVFPHHHVPCGECYYCTHGSPTMCTRYRTSNLDPGGFSEFFRVPSWNVERGGVLHIPAQVSFDEGTLIEPMACCVRALDMCGVESGQSALVVGAGPVGMIHTLLLESMNIDVMVSDVNRSRLGFAQKVGAETVDAAAEDVPAAVRRHTDGRGADLVVVASGSPRAITQGLGSVRKGGKVCIFGIPTRGAMLEYDISEVYLSEVSIVTAYGATEVETVRALDFIATRKVDARPLVTHRFPLSEFEQAVMSATSGEGMKVVITP